MTSDDALAPPEPTTTKPSPVVANPVTPAEPGVTAPEVGSTHDGRTPSEWITGWDPDAHPAPLE
jgi:hypothetical protein